MDYAKMMSWFFRGSERMRLPVAAKKAFSTAGAATEIVGSPTPAYCNAINVDGARAA